MSIPSPVTLAGIGGRLQFPTMTNRYLPAFLGLALLAASSLPAQGLMQAAPSGRGTTEVVLTLADSAARANAQPAKIRIDYGQPHIRGRQLHTGDLVPYDSTWRLGANDATTLTTDVDLIIGGARVPKGAYVLQALPTRTGWKLMVQKSAASPMAAAMSTDRSNDVARIDLTQVTLQSPVESLSIWLIPSTQPGPAKGELRISWANTQLSTNWTTR